MAARRQKREVTKDELEKFVLSFPHQLEFDGMRYTDSVKMLGGTWKKPVAAVVGEKFYLVEDL